MAVFLPTNATPGGPVSPEVYAGEGVRFAAGSALVQASSTIADTSKLTISMWVRRLTSDFTYLFSADVDDGNRITAELFSPAFLATDLNVTLQNTAGGGLAAFNTIDGLTPTVWHHVFVTVDTNKAAGQKLCTFYLDGDLWTQYAVGYPIDSGSAFNIGLLGAALGFPGSPRTLEGQPSIELSDVQVWTNLLIDPTDTQTTYSAKASASRAIRDLVNYVNSRGLSPVEALAVMNIESIYGTLSRNYFQFLQQSAFNLILGYTGTTTNNTDLNRAYANAWSGFRPDGSVVGAPNNYDKLVRQLTADVPFGWQKYLIHNLGGSVSEVGAAGSINGYRLLTAWVDDDTLTLSEVGGLTLMTAQAKIWGSTGPIGTVTNSTTVSAAIDALITVWNAAEADALRFLDSSTQPNLSYFIDEDGLAVPPAAATDKFGLQTFLFTGIKEAFAINQGSGGDMTLVGTLTDVPGPND